MNSSTDNLCPGFDYQGHPCLNDKAVGSKYCIFVFCRNHRMPPEYTGHWADMILQPHRGPHRGPHRYYLADRNGYVSYAEAPDENDMNPRK